MVSGETRFLVFVAVKKNLLQLEKVTRNLGVNSLLLIPVFDISFLRYNDVCLDDTEKDSQTVSIKTQVIPPCCVSSSVLCTVDLTKRQGVSVQIEKVGSDPYCEMSIDSKVEKKINVAAGTKASLSFLDCPNEDVRLTASSAIGKMNIY